MVMALEGIRVVDMTVWHHGPGGGTFLADMGAEVIKVEERLSGDPGRHGGSLGGVENEYGLSYYFENNNRDKKSLAINLKTEKGHEVITRLLKKSDIFLSNMRKSGLGRLGLSYDEVKEINPDIVYAHGSGQGDKGPLLNRQSNDIIGQFWGAYVSYGSAEGPMSVWSDFADRGGAVMLAYGAALAFLGRERHGISQEVNTSLLGGQVHLGALNFQQRLFEGEAVSPLSNGERHLPNPLYNHLSGQRRGMVLHRRRGYRRGMGLPLPGGRHTRPGIRPPLRHPGQAHQRQLRRPIRDPKGPLRRGDH